MPNLRNLTFAGAAAIALGAMAVSGSAISATPPVATAPARAVTPLDKVSNPTSALAQLRVENFEGANVGTVVDVVTRSDGKPLAVTVDVTPLVGTKRWVGIDASRIGLDSGRHVLVARMTKAEIKALPSLL